MNDVMNQMPDQDKSQPLESQEAGLPDYASRRNPKRSVVWLAAISLTILMMPLALAGALVVPGPLSVTETIAVPRGTSSSSVARSLAERNAIHHPLLFHLASRGIAQGLLKAGEYRIEPGMSAADIALMMREGRSVARYLTVPEGLTSGSIAALIANAPAMTGTIDAISLEEGSLLPETYRYTYGDARAEMVERMREAMSVLVKESWPKRDSTLPLQMPEEAMILASMIEKETGKASERARIAGVFYNRLRAGMRLQSDPTVLYAIWKANGVAPSSLSREDMSFPSPYNTYASDGLPPKPICNPGKASLEAALHPERHDYYYFVADGAGGHVFSRALAEHNNNVAAHLKPKRKPSQPVGTSRK